METMRGFEDDEFDLTGTESYRGRPSGTCTPMFLSAVTLCFCLLCFKSSMIDIQY